MAARERNRRLSIRTLATSATVLLGLLIALVITALLWTSAEHRRASVTAIRDAESRAIASELELSLLTYQRLSNFYFLTRDPELLATRDEIRTEMTGFLVQAEALVGDSHETTLVSGVRERLDEYWRAREVFEAEAEDLEDVINRSLPPLNEAVNSLEALRDLNELQVDRAHDRVLAVDHLANRIGWITGLVLIAGLVVAALGVRRYLLRPILDLHDVVGRLRRGESEVRAREHGVDEIAELTRDVNDMASALARQREAQLTFLAGVAHELRNPLSALKIGLQAQREQPAEVRDSMGAILERQLDRLARMIEDLLDATRIEAGKLELRIAEIDLRGLAADIIDLYAPTSEKHRLELRAPAGEIRVAADPLRIEQVLSNLLSNAIKFSPDGGVIEVAIAVEGSHATLAVTDPGVGISPEEIKNLFVPFRRSRPELASGAGLGLSVVRRIVTAHGGTIDVDSEVGAGTTFRVNLPLAGS